MCTVSFFNYMYYTCITKNFHALNLMFNLSTNDYTNLTLTGITCNKHNIYL